MSAARSLDASASLDAIIRRIIALRRLQREIRGEVAEGGGIDEPKAHTLSYRYGTRRHNPGTSRGAGRG